MFQLGARDCNCHKLIIRALQDQEWHESRCLHLNWRDWSAGHRQELWRVLDSRDCRLSQHRLSTLKTHVPSPRSSDSCSKCKIIRLMFQVQDHQTRVPSAKSSDSCSKCKIIRLVFQVQDHQTCVPSARSSDSCSNCKIIRLSPAISCVSNSTRTFVYFQLGVRNEQ